MTLSDVAKPSRWPEVFRTAIVTAVLAALIPGLVTVYSVGGWHASTESHLTVIDEKLSVLSQGQDSARKALADQNEKANTAVAAAAALAQNVEQGRAQYRPRIESLEKQEQKLETGLAVLGEKVDTVQSTVGRHDAEITETTTNTRILLDKLAPESAPHRPSNWAAPRGN